MAQAITRMILSQKKRKKFLQLLARTGKVAASARAVGYTSTDYLNKLRRDDEEFAEDWELAVQAATHVLEDEANRRAIDGVMEPVFYKGEIVGHKLAYSDTLLQFLLRGLKPNTYRDSARHNDIDINFGIAVLPMTAHNDSDWETSAKVMHKSQQTITLEAKPIENNMIKVKRSD